MTQCEILLTVFLALCWSVVRGRCLAVERMRTMKGLHGKRGKFSEWSTWSKCSEKICCRHGVTSRRRHCMKSPCTGIETESEDCPGRNCEECSSGPLATTTIAATGSFINSECETSRKYWSSGPLLYLIPPLIYKQFPALKDILHSGFFGVQKVYLPAVRTSNKQMIVYKFCFEPSVKLTSRQARRIFHSNRRKKVSHRKSNTKQQRVNGIAITALRSGKLFNPGIFWTAIDSVGVTAHYYYGKRPFKTV